MDERQRQQLNSDLSALYEERRDAIRRNEEVVIERLNRKIQIIERMLALAVENS